MTLPKDPIKREEYCRKLSDALSGEKHPLYGKHHSESTRKKIGDAQKGEKHHLFGKHHTEITRKKMSETRKGKQCGEKNSMFGKRHTEITRKKISDRMSGEGNPMFGIKISIVGWHHSKETRSKIGKGNLGKQRSEEQCKKMHEINCGEKCHWWKGGISFGKYCVKFNQEFKNRVRAFFGYKCVECGKTQEENQEALTVHHVNYDKMMCCNDVKPLFVALCRSHNSMANTNRDCWENHYTTIINEKYNGQCYLPKVC